MSIDTRISKVSSKSSNVQYNIISTLSVSIGLYIQLIIRDKKLFAVIAAIIIVAAAGVVAFVTLADDDGDVKALTGSGRLLVY